MADEVEEVCVILLCVLKVSLHSVALDRSKLCLYDSKDIGLHYPRYSKLTLAMQFSIFSHMNIHLFICL